jgi:hypothetical protein
MSYTALLLSLSLIVAAKGFTGQARAGAAEILSQSVYRTGSQTSFKGPDEFFNGNPAIPAK